MEDHKENNSNETSVFNLDHISSNKSQLTSDLQLSLKDDEFPYSCKNNDDLCIMEKEPCDGSGDEYPNPDHYDELPDLDPYNSVCDLVDLTQEVDTENIKSDGMYTWL